jgi:hypothetical protein
MSEEILCISCLHRLWPETPQIMPGQNVKCRRGIRVNKISSEWVFQKTECGHYEKSGTAQQNYNWIILSTAFDDIDAPNKIVCSVVEFRSWLWQKNRIDKEQFRVMLEELMLVNSPFRMRIHLSGGPTGHYTRANFVLIDGKKYLQMEMNTIDHMKYMEGHRG